MSTFSVNTHHAYLNTDIVFTCNGIITIEDIITGEYFTFTDEFRTHLKAGHHIFKTDNHEEEIIIEDAIKLGGSHVESAFVFDNNPWMFVTTKDRLYIENRKTCEEKIEFNITPESISQLESYNQPCVFFLFKTKHDYAIYNVLTGKIIFRFVNHIYSNCHLIIYEKDNELIVYNYVVRKEIVRFNGQYSFGQKFYFVKDKKLHLLNLRNLFTKAIEKVGEIKEEDILVGNYLLKLERDFPDRKLYSYYCLENEEKQITRTELIFPYYVEKWEGKTGETNSFQDAKNLYLKYTEDYNQVAFSYPDIKQHIFGIRVTQNICESLNGKNTLTIVGEIISYPAMQHTIPFVLHGKEGESINFQNASIEKFSTKKEVTEDHSNIGKYSKEKGETFLCESLSGNFVIIKIDKKIILRNVLNGTNEEIFQESYDSSSYRNAYFTSDGKSVVLQISEKEGQLLGIEDLQTTQFYVEGFTVANNEGINGYKPEITIQSTRKPVWRDPITLGIVSEDKMSGHIFMSPNGVFSAKNSHDTYYYNRLTGKEISLEEYNQLCTLYNWRLFPFPEDKEKREIIKNREDLLRRFSKEQLTEHLVEKYSTFFNLDKRGERESMQKKVDTEWDEYLHNKNEFTPLFVDKMGYVTYQNTITKKEDRILIGRNVWYLNYVSFSYDCHYLAFGAKMNKDIWRDSMDGVFVLYDLQKREVVVRKDGSNLQAVWMALFNKNGDVAYYDSSANAYLMRPNYEETIIASGKSLLCFSPSGKYIACSDQKYIDYAHHPHGNWGHQPSGNVFIYSVDDFKKCIEQYNDLGDGIEGVHNERKTSRAGNVASVAFSQDEKRLLVVGSDGIVVVRNLKSTC